MTEVVKRCPNTPILMVTNPVERMAKRLDSPKLIYVMRHPIERLVSHYIHQWSQNVMSCDINEAIDRYEELTAYSCYSRQLDPYFKQFGQESVLPVFSESIRHNPQQVLEQVATFIGYQGNVLWHSDTGAQNISKERIRAFKGYRYLVESRVMTFLRRRLVPQRVRDKIKDRLMMQQRPEIDAQHLKQLEDIFDKDLAGLKDWLGGELTCEQFSL